MLIDKPYMKDTYQVEYSYYQHNDGRANNGQYRQTLNYDTLAQAQAVAVRIQAAIEEKGTEVEQQQTMDDFHPYSGHFSWVKVYEVSRREIKVSQ